MKKLLGIMVLVLVLYGTVMLSNVNAFSVLNHQNLAQRMGFYGVLTLGVGVLIISGGIDLSIGSVVGLSAVSLALLLDPKHGLSPGLAVALVLLGGVVIGLFHGLLVTQLRLQPFIVTLCGLFIYRGLAQWVTRTPQGSPRDVGIGGVPNLGPWRFLVTGNISGVSTILLLMLALAALVAVLLHVSVYGRYLYAIGYNEQAARYAGIATNRYKILAYVICSFMAALGGVLFLFDLQTASPSSAGSWYELYAITGAVLGGCSLRGGEGTVAGMLLGTAVLPLLRNLCNFFGALNVLEFAVIGFALLLGTITDELLKRRAAARG